MFEPIDKPCNPRPVILGFPVVGAALVLIYFLQVLWPRVLDLRTPVPHILIFHVIRLKKPLNHVAAITHGKEKPAAAAGANSEKAHPAASVIPGTPQWRQHVERGRGLSFEIVAEQSLPVLRANGVPLAIDVRRPRGTTLLYNLQTGTLSRGVVADDAVVREVEGLPAEFAEALREAERELGARPRVWALYSNDLFSALRSLTQDALQQESVPVDSVKLARVRLSLAGGRAFGVKLLSHF